MIDDYEGFLVLDELLKKEYNYTYNENNPEDFFSQKFIHMEFGGRTAYAWIFYKGEEYLFKPIDDFEWNVWGELLSCKYAEMLGIPCASYRACSLGSKKGVISKKIQKKDENLILGLELIQRIINEHLKEASNEEVFSNFNIDGLRKIPSILNNIDNNKKNKFLLSYLNNLEHIEMLLSSSTKISNDEMKKMMHFLSQMLLFEIITLQGDCNVNNWGAIKKEFLTPAPLFDNATSFGLGYSNMNERANLLRDEVMNYRFFKDSSRIESIIYQSFPLFTVSSKNIKSYNPIIKDSYIKVFDDFLELADEYYKSLANSYVEKVTQINFDEIVKLLEDKNGIIMEDNVKNYIMTVIEYHLKKLLEVIKKREKESVNYGRK